MLKYLSLLFSLSNSLANKHVVKTFSYLSPFGYIIDKNLQQLTKTSFIIFEEFKSI